jgi:Lrp/AsnC family leucine-responsive transcriptional regulator
MDKRKPLDGKDLQILALLQRDGRLPNAELARRVHLSASPCLERVRRLEQDGYIRDYVARLAPEPVNLAQVVFLQVRLALADEAANTNFLRQIEQIEAVQECHMMAGDYDYLLKLRVPDMRAFRELLTTQLGALPGIERTVSHVVINEVKSSTALPLGIASLSAEHPASDLI